MSELYSLICILFVSRLLYKSSLSFDIFPPNTKKVKSCHAINAIISIVEVDYDAGNGLTGLGTISYDYENSLNNPANVLLDYLKNDRYGCGLTDDDLDLDSFDDMYDYANAQVDFTTSSNVSSTHSRWQINGGISTFQPNLTNIENIKLCQTERLLQQN